MGATTSADAQASYSNYGTCLDIYAPGSSITSASYSSDTAVATMSGTSMASPHVAGAVALYLETNPTATPAAVTQAVVNLATPDRVTGAGAGSPNRLLYSQFEGGTPADTVPPQTWITAPAAGATVGGTVLVQAEATDAVGVSRVDFYVDGVFAGGDTSAPYAYAWETAGAGNGTHTLTTKAYDTSNNMGESAAVAVTVSNAPSVPEAVVNGGFEAAPTPWTFAGAASWASGPYAHTGSAYALLGNRNKASGSVSQAVTVPSTAPATLRFWLSVASNETAKTATDLLYVEVVAGGSTTAVGSFSNLDRGPAGTYGQQAFDLSAWAGQTVTVRFRATTDKTRATSFYLDDVSLR